ELGDGLAELFPFLRVLDGVIERAGGETDHLRSDADAALVEGFDRGLVAFADLTQDVRLGHAAILEDPFAGAAGTDAELVFLLADRESGGAALDDEGGDA